MPNKPEGIVNIKGRDYKNVALRVTEFREDEKYSHYGMESFVLENTEERCTVKVIITDPEGRIHGSGIAFEDRHSSKLNETSYIENCETSAYGRALASIGFAGSQYASAEEVSSAVIQQARNEAVAVMTELMRAVSAHIASLCVIREGIASGDLSSASEAWFELPDEDKAALWVAPTKGGFFTTSEREVIKSTEFREANS